MALTAQDQSSLDIVLTVAELTFSFDRVSFKSVLTCDASSSLRNSFSNCLSKNSAIVFLPSSSVFRWSCSGTGSVPAKHTDYHGYKYCTGG